MQNKLAQFMLMLVMSFGISGLAQASSDSYDDDFHSDDFFDDYHYYDGYHKKFVREKFSAKLNGFQEVPAVLTKGKGRFLAQTHGYTLKFKLSYNNLTEPVNVRFAHIHFAQPGVNGGVLVWLCDNTGNGPADTPACPEQGEKLHRTITADDVQPIAAQGVEAGDFKALVKILKKGVAYVNVHTDAFPSGELRGNIKD